MTKKSKKKIVLIITPIVILSIIYIFADRIPFLSNTNTKGSDSEALETENKIKGGIEEKVIELPEPKSPDEYKEEESKGEDTPKPTTNTPTTPSTGNWWDYPKDIKTTTRSGNDLLVLVNKEYKLPSTYAPSDLVYANTSGIRVTTVRSYMLRSIVINDLKALNNDAKKAGLDLSMISGYRAYQTQADTYNYWVNYNGGNTAVVDQISARAGHSQHQLGTALDFSSSEIGDRLGSEFDNTKASKWLEENAWKYGFIISYPKGYETTTGYSYESWHYRYIGRDNAKKVVESGKILEVWLR